MTEQPPTDYAEAVLNLYDKLADRGCLLDEQPSDYAAAVLAVYRQVAFAVHAPIPPVEPSVNGSAEAMAVWRQQEVR